MSITTTDMFGAVSCADLMAEYEAKQAFQATLHPKDMRHDAGFEFSDDNQWLTLYWGGYGYDYEMSRLSRPEDLLWLLHHIGKKDWEGMRPERMWRLIERVARVKDWPMYRHAAHPNEAPKPNHDKLKERQKMTPAIRYAVIKRDGYRCRACGFSVQDGAHLHIDHIVAVANGGETKLANLQTLCTSCNLGKGAR
jgi:hypothetical protein